MNKKLLVVDDNKGCSDLYKQRFELAGYDVQIVYSAEDALELLKTYHPDAMLLDIMLPKMQGDELLRIIKSDGRTSDIKVIVLTALSLATEKETIIRAQADDYALKIEVTPRDLVAKVDGLIARPAYVS